MPTRSMIVVNEILIVMIGSTALAQMGEASGLTPNQIVMAWCIVGGCLGAFCSLHFFRVPPSDHAQADIAWQFAVNLILSAVLSPLITPYVAAWTGAPNGMESAVPTATILGIIAQRVVARYLPVAQRIADARVKSAAKAMGADESDG